MNEMMLPSRHRNLEFDTGIRALAIWGRARYHSVAEVPHNIYLTLRLMTPRSLGSKFHHLQTSCNLPAKVQAMSWVASDLWHLRSDSLPQEHLEPSATIMEIQVDILRGGGQGIQCRRFLVIDVVLLQLTIYSLSRKMSDQYPSSHSVWHPVPPVPHLVQEYRCIFNAGTLPFPHGTETRVALWQTLAF